MRAGKVTDDDIAAMASAGTAEFPAGPPGDIAVHAVPSGAPEIEEKP